MTDSHHRNFVNRRVLKINVGFLLAEGVGYQRVLDFDLPRIQVDDDVELDYLRGSLCLSRNSRGILVRGTLETPVISECSRCLTPISVPVALEIEELYAFPASPDIVYFVEETGILDLAPLLREEAILAVPMGVLCRPDCAGLCHECGQNLNEGPCACRSETIDPRLAILSQLIDSKPEDE